MRHTGIQIVGDVPWGTHFCQFYQDKQDLIEISVPYFRAGLENGEFCIWVTSDPLRAQEALDVLAKDIADFDGYLGKRQIEIKDYNEWFTGGDAFDAERVLDSWTDEARKRGFDGLRVSGNTFWLGKADWRGFTEFEATLDGVIGRYRMLAMCTYSLARCGAEEVVEVASNHTFALVKRAGRWEVVEQPRRKRLETVLRESEAHGKFLAETMLQGLVYQDADGRITSMNPAAVRILGKTPAELLGETSVSVEHHTIREDTSPFPGMEHPAMVALATGREVRDVVMGIYNPREQQYRWVNISAVPVFRAGEPKPWQVYTIFDDITERRRVEEAYRTAALFPYQNPEPVLRAGRNGVLLYSNPAAAPVVAEWRSAPGQSVPANVREAVEGALAQGAPRELEMSIGGQEFSFLVAPISGHDYANLYARDVTERRRVERALRQQSEWLRVTLTSIGDAVMATDVAGRVTFLNPVAAALTGWTEEEALGRPSREVFRIVDERSRGQGEDIIARALREGFVVSLANYTALVSRDGSEVPIEDSAAPIRDGAGAVAGVVLVFHDVTAKRRAEEALRNESEQRRLALEAAALGAWDYRFDTGEVFWDERCRDTFGVPAGVRIGYDDAIQCIHPDDRAATREAVTQAIAGADGGRYHREFRVVWPDRAEHWVSSHGRVYFEGEGSERRAVRFIGVNMDITERKRAQEALLQSQKLESIGLLAGGIAHDFNNLLVGVVGNASLAQDILPRGNPASEILKNIVQSGEQAAHLTRQMLAYAGKGRFIIEPVNLSGIVGDASLLIRSSISKKITLNLFLAADLPAVESDPSQMQQVFMNLALNAGEAIGSRPGVITVSTGEMELDAATIRQEVADWPISPGRFVFLEVADTGCGMGEATRGKVFDPFFTTKFQGRGLGLAAVGGIVRAHKGAIKVTTAAGKGSTFRVLLPVSTSGAATNRPAVEEQPDLRGKGTILVVDDEQVVRGLAKRALERLGYEVLLAESGAAAIDTVRNQRGRIGLVVLDLSMPGMDGDEALRRLREVEPDLEIVVSSGFSEAETLQAFQGAWVSGFIQKPYTIRELAAEVKAALS